MKSDFLGIIFDIIVLIILAVLIFYIIMVFIGIATGNELKYIGYLNSIADAINSGSNGVNGEVFINNYDYNYVFVLTNNNGWYLQLYHCLPPNFVVGLLSVKVVYWNVSTTDKGNTVIFAPALAFCKLVKQISLNSNISQININIQGLNDNAGLLSYSNNTDYLGIFQIFVNIINNFFPTTSFFLTILNDTAITCNDNGCTFTSTINENGNTYQEKGIISCTPNQYINPNTNNLLYNPSDCVELSGFPQNPQVQLSNLEGEIVSSETFTSIIQTFQMNFPLLYFAGSLPPTVMDIEVNSNGGKANINIYIGETVST